MSFERAAIIGTGLIGGSFGLALKKHGLVSHIVGVARSVETRQTALQRGIADDMTSDADRAVVGADLVYIATPVRAIQQILQTIAPNVEAEALVTDAGSTKRSIMNWAQECLQGRCGFIGGHPLAGSEQSGPESAQADLFENSVYMITCNDWTPAYHKDALCEVLKKIGADVRVCEADWHDRTLAATSHLPHGAAAALAITIADLQLAEDDLRTFSGKGLGDTTRIAGGPPEVWSDILLDNAENVEEMLERLKAAIELLRATIENKDEDALLQMLARAAQTKESLDP